jgi:hypothetical protein
MRRDGGGERGGERGSRGDQTGHGDSTTIQCLKVPSNQAEPSVIRYRVKPQITQ